MIQNLLNSEWRILRRLIRHNRQIGRQLDPRYPYDIQSLRRAKLIRTVGERKAGERKNDELEQEYEITDEGRIAAEYGYYLCEVKYGLPVAVVGWKPSPEE